MRLYLTHHDLDPLTRFHFLLVYPDECHMKPDIVKYTGSDHRYHQKRNRTADSEYHITQRCQYDKYRYKQRYDIIAFFLGTKQNKALDNQIYKQDPTHYKARVGKRSPDEFSFFVECKTDV